MARRIVRTDDPLGTRNNAAQSASESAALATMAGGMTLGAMWPRQAEAQAEAQDDPARTQVPDNDVRKVDAPAHDAAPLPPHASVTDMPDHAGIAVVVDAQAAVDANIDIAGFTPVPDAAPIASVATEFSASARVDATVDHDGVSVVADADVSAASSIAVAAAPDATGLPPSHTLLPSLFDSVAEITGNLTGTLNNLTEGVSETLASVTGQVTELLGPDGVVGDVTATLGDTLDATQNVTQDLLSSVAGIAAAPVEPLTDILGAPSVVDDIATPAVASFAPDTLPVLDSSPMIDTSGLDMASLAPSEVTGLSLGFLGTSYTDAVDPHDLGFSPLGGGLHGLV